MAQVDPDLGMDANRVRRLFRKCVEVLSLPFPRASCVPHAPVRPRAGALAPRLGEARARLVTLALFRRDAGALFLQGQEDDTIDIGKFAQVAPPPYRSPYRPRYRSLTAPPPPRTGYAGGAARPPRARGSEPRPARLGLLARGVPCPHLCRHHSAGITLHVFCCCCQ